MRFVATPFKVPFLTRPYIPMILSQEYASDEGFYSSSSLGAEGNRVRSSIFIYISLNFTDMPLKDVLLSDKVHRCPWFTLRSIGCFNAMHLLECPCHVVGKGAHRLHALYVLSRLPFFTTVCYVPVL